MKLPNELASALLDKDKQKAKEIARKIINEKDTAAWRCIVENSEFIFDFIKKNIVDYFSDVIDDSNYMNLFEFFKIHSSEWDEYLIQILIRFSYSDKELTAKMLNLLENGTEDEKAYSAKYFTYIQDNKASYHLFKAYQCEYEPLKYNTAAALGHVGDVYSYDYFINKLESEDDWEKIDAAQFLCWYGNKKSFPDILKAMSKSAMSEYIAGEAATLDDIYKYFDIDDPILKNLAFECFENILAGLSEIWPLAVILDFKIYDTVQKLISLSKESHDENHMPRYSTLLLKCKSLFNLFIENEHYRMNEDKSVINELEEIHGLFMTESEDYWNSQKSLMLQELRNYNEKRVAFALDVIAEVRFMEAKNAVLEVLNNDNISQQLVFKVINAISRLGIVSEIGNKDTLLSRLSDQNLKAAAENLLI